MVIEVSFLGGDDLLAIDSDWHRDCDESFIYL